MGGVGGGDSPVHMHTHTIPGHTPLLRVPVGVLHGLPVALVPLRVAVPEHLLVPGQLGLNLLRSLKGHFDRHGYRWRSEVRVHHLRAPQKRQHYC